MRLAGAACRALRSAGTEMGAASAEDLSHRIRHRPRLLLSKWGAAEYSRHPPADRSGNDRAPDRADRLLSLDRARTHRSAASACPVCRGDGSILGTSLVA